jgi:hypothetical protein
MNTIARISLFLFLIVVATSSLQAQLLLSDDFSGTSGTVLTSAGWTISGTSTTNPLTIGSSGSLTFAGFPGSGAGNALPMANTGQDVYKGFTAANSGSVYLSFMINVSAALTGDYLIALSPSASQTNYYARLHIKSSGSGFSFGINKSNEVSGGSLYGNTVYNLNTTYFAVLKYTFAGTTADSLNDPINLYVFASGSSIATEPSTGEISAYVNTTKNDAVDLAYVTLRQGTATSAPTLVIDGIRVSRSWASILTGVESGENVLPSQVSLSQNYPNPFNPSTTISYQLPKASNVTLLIFNALGQRVATLVEGGQKAGFHKVQWNASVPSGIYFYRLQAGQYMETRAMTLLK